MRGIIKIENMEPTIADAFGCLRRVYSNGPQSRKKIILDCGDILVKRMRSIDQKTMFCADCAERAGFYVD